MYLVGKALTHYPLNADVKQCKQQQHAQMGIMTRLKRSRLLQNLRNIVFTTIVLIVITSLLRTKRLHEAGDNIEFVINNDQDGTAGEEGRKNAQPRPVTVVKAAEKPEKIGALGVTGMGIQCPLQWSGITKGIQSAEKPLINLDRSKFLLPVLINGPNNQLIGFRKSIYIAIRLNRTIVVPLFFKHKINDDQGNFIDPTHRVNLSVLSKLLPIVTLEQFAERCHGNFEAVLRLRKMTPSMYRSLERDYSMTFAGPKGKPLIELPAEIHPKKGKEFIVFNSSKSIIRSLYDTEAACAIHPYHFANLEIPSKVPRGDFPTSIGDLSDSQLYSEIIRFTPLPDHVTQLAEAFVRDVIGEKPFMSVHWRFDKTDWMRRCLADTPWGTENRRKMCEVILQFTPDEIAQAIANKAKSDATTDCVYLASPPGEEKLMNDVISSLRNKHGTRVFTALDLRQQWKSSYTGCVWLWNDENDILSNTEMEICRMAEVFLRSSASTWSKNVDLARNPKQFPLSTKDDRILALVKEVHFAKSKK